VNRRACKGTIVFSHANGFPAGTYRSLFEVWRAAGWRVLAPDKFGHDPAFPVRSNWSPTRDELLAFIAREAPGARVHLVGHSLGGFVSLLAACKRPAVAASVVLIDSPLVAGWRAHTIQVAKATGLMARVSPGKVSRFRRWQWPSADDAHRHFAAKAVFARWDPAVLRDYVAAGIEPDPEHGGVRLAFRRDVETRFYNTLPHHLSRVLARHPPKCPLHFIGGTQSAEMRQVGMAATRMVCRDRITMLAGTHLVPMEKPTATAMAVLAALGRSTDPASTPDLPSGPSRSA
jgi:pimeloyl-ACP methyl ester carboxylesterase